MARAAAPKPAKPTRLPRPSTRHGRALRTALSHGLFSTAPVIPGVESEDQWLSHLAGVLQSLAPVGDLETLLAQRVAYHFWRLKRLIRYETQLVTSADPDARTSMYHGRSLTGASGSAREPALEEWQRTDRATYDRAHRILNALDTVMFADESQPVSAAIALEVFEAIRVPAADAPLDQFSVPGTAGTPLTAFTEWTAGLVRRTVRALCQHYRRDPDQQLKFAAMRNRDFASRIPDDDDDSDDATEIEEDHNEDDAEDGTIRLYPRRSRGLPTSMPIDNILERFTRYESHISRELRTALREFDAWQSRRLDRPVSHQLEVVPAPDDAVDENTDSTN